MWRTELACSCKQIILISVFYFTLLVLMIMLFQHTYLDSVSFIGVIILAFEWWRACRYSKKMRGELALFYDINQLYWSKQRWYVVKKPLFLRYAVVIHLESKRNGQKRVLFLMDDNISYQDWRSLHYFLRQWFTDCH